MNNSYRDHAYVIEAQQDQGVWIGHFRLLGDPSTVPVQHAQKFTWVPTERGWATQAEAETNAEEAAHAAIDAIYGVNRRLAVEP